MAHQHLRTSSRRVSYWLGGFLGTAGLIGCAAFAFSAPTVKPLKANAVDEKLTFTKDIAPMVYQNCATCHHTGEVAPFPLVTYSDVKKRAKLISAVTQSRYMPPWHADSHGEFTNERHLSDAQIAMLTQWSNAGAPEGDPANLPPPPHFTSGWKLGEPDMVLEPKSSYTLSADGADVYRCFVLPTHLLEDKYVTAMEVRPGNRTIVHHVIAYLDDTGAARTMDAKDGQPGYTSSGGGINLTPSGAIGGWVPGNEPEPLPNGVGIQIAKGSDVVLQVHYHKIGKSETDQTKIALYFSKVPVDKRVRFVPVAYPRLSIPAGDAHYSVQMSMPVPANITVLQVIPHMHWLGRTMTVSATLPDNRQENLITVPNWDFNWQTTYNYKQPVELPRGSEVRLTATYDNSADNPRNPNNPPKTVTWGEQTTNEMCIAFLAYTVDAEHLTKGIQADGYPELVGKNFNRQRFIHQVMMMFDKNGDGKLDASEQAAMMKFFREMFGAGAGTRLSTAK